MMNHLWQSTVFAGACALLALTLKNNRAQVRYWIWLAASWKFLVPFSLLVEAGRHWGRHTVAALGSAPSALAQVIDEAGAPFRESALPAAGHPPAAYGSSAGSAIWLLWVVWAIGFGALVLRWWIRWRSVRAALRTASPMQLACGVTAMTSPAFAEPGVFGIRRPVLLLPAGVADLLTPPQLEAVVEHELCHMRRRDNLVAAMHMAVEALFWFHPLVWWLGTRLMEEREHACDDEVLRKGAEPHTYAEGILRICEFSLEPPLPCVAGVTGANLKKRIEAIVSGRAAVRLGAARKAMLAAAGAAALGAPVLVGVLRAPAIQAQPAVSSAKFEVASIQSCKPGDVGGGRGGKQGGSGGRIRWDPQRLHEECQSVYNLIRDAYLAYPEGKPWQTVTREEPSADARGLENAGCTGCGRGFPPVSRRVFQQPLQGSPGWLETARYTIDARAERPTTPEMMRGPMMQALLQDRFQLKIHRESTEAPVYALTVAEGGPKLKPSPEGSCLSFSEMIKLPPRPPADRHGPLPCGAVMLRNGKATFPGTTIDGLCRNLSFLFDRDVIDKTGIEGFYDIEIDADRVLLPAGDSIPRDDGMPPPPQTDRAATAREFQRAMPKIGLKMQPAKGPGVLLVIDRVERPGEN